MRSSAEARDACIAADSDGADDLVDFGVALAVVAGSSAGGGVYSCGLDKISGPAEWRSKTLLPHLSVIAFACSAVMHCFSHLTQKTWRIEGMHTTRRGHKSEPRT